MTTQNLPPTTYENEPLHIQIRYLRFIIHLILSGIDAGDFDNPDERQANTDAIRQHV